MNPLLTPEGLNELADELAEVYGDNPKEVGAVDGTEDDFGDLMGSAFETLTGDPNPDYGDLWDRFQDAAIESKATTMREWIADLAAIVAAEARS